MERQIWVLIGYFNCPDLDVRESMKTHWFEDFDELVDFVLCQQDIDEEEDPETAESVRDQLSKGEYVDEESDYYYFVSSHVIEF